ncbi:MAG: anti-sigma factor family protein [Brevefilum sp.]
MKKKRQHTRDLALLSAYLDGELQPHQYQALVSRLQAEPDLRERLESLRKVKLTVGYLPRLHAHRNYTLTPEMVTVRKKKAAPFAGTLRLASALAAILMVALFGVEFLFTSGPLARTQMTSVPQMESAVMMDDAQPEPLIVWGAPGTGGAGGFVDGRGGDASVMEAPVMIESMPVEEEAAVEELLTEELPSGMPEEVPEMMLEAELSPPADTEMEALQMAAEGEKQMLILGINLDEGGEIIQRSGDTLGIQTAQPAWRVILRAVQIALGVIVLGGGLTWWLLRRRVY